MQPPLRASVLFGLFLCAATQAASSLELAQTIPLPDVVGRIDHFAVDTQHRRLFVAALGNDSVEVVDSQNGKSIKSIRGCAKPQGLLFLPKLNLLYVGNGGSGQIDVFDCDSFQLKQTIKALPDADNLRSDVTGETAYVGFGDGAIGVINTTSGTLTHRIDLKGHPESFRLEHAGTRIFANVPSERCITVIDRVKGSVTTNWPLTKFGGNFPMALDETNHRLFIGCRQPAHLLVMNTASGEVISDLDISGDTDDLFFDAKRKLVYAICGAGFVDIVEQRDRACVLKERIPTRTGARTGLFIPSQDLLCVAVPKHGNETAEIRLFKVAD